MSGLFHLRTEPRDACAVDATDPTVDGAFCLERHDLKSNIQVLRTRRASRKSESDSGAGGKKARNFVALISRI
jgi:hypothetical protein